MADKTLLEEFLERRPLRKALLGAGEKAVARTVEAAIEVPVKIGADAVSARVDAFLKRRRGG